MSPINNNKSPSTTSNAVIYKTKDLSGPYQIIEKFKSWDTDRTFSFNERDPYGQAILKHPAVLSTYDRIRSALGLACRSGAMPEASFKVRSDLGAIGFWGQACDFVSTLLGYKTYGLVGKAPEFGVIGSFDSKSRIDVSNVDCEAGKADVEVHLSNTTGAASLTRYSYSNPKSTILNNNPFGETGMYGNVYERWDVKDQIKFNKDDL